MTAIRASRNAATPQRKARETLLHRFDDQPPKRITIAVLLSLLVHLVVIAILILLLGLRWLHRGGPVPAEAFELTFIEEKTPYISTTAAQETDQPPDKAQFESDKNTRAASEAPAMATNALPSQEGEKKDILDFDNRRFTLGPQPRETRPSPPASKPFRAQPQIQPTEQTAAEDARSDTPRKQQDLALLRANPAQQQASQLQPERTAAPPPQPKAYQPERRVTRIQGGVSNRGRSATNAAATPLGRYKKMLSDAIGSRWYYYVNNDMALMNIGTAIIRFRVTQEGKVNSVKVLSNSSNESLAACSIRSIIEAEISKIPPEVAAILEGGELEVDYTFSILGN